MRRLIETTGKRVFDILTGAFTFETGSHVEAAELVLEAAIDGNRSRGGSFYAAFFVGAVSSVGSSEGGVCCEKCAFIAATRY